MATIHVARDGTDIGTFAIEDVQEGLRTGRFLPTDMAWEAGMPDWRSLSQVVAEKPAAAMPASGATETNTLPVSPPSLSSGAAASGGGLYTTNMTSKPRAVFWYQIYCGLLAALYLLVTIAGVVILAIPAASLKIEDSEKFLIAGIAIASGIPFLFASLLPLFFEPKPWLWIYGIALIALGLTSCCFWPICIPLLIFWLKPDIQRFFGRNA